MLEATTFRWVSPRNSLCTFIKVLNIPEYNTKAEEHLFYKIAPLHSVHEYDVIRRSPPLLEYKLLNCCSILFCIIFENVVFANKVLFARDYLSEMACYAAYTGLSHCSSD